jgi:hypothetical protein
MSEESPDEMLRSDEGVRLAGEKIIDLFRYFAGVCWAPVVIISTFFPSSDVEFGWMIRLILSLAVVALVVAGSIFFLAYQKQLLMLSHALLGEKAIMKAAEVNPNAKEDIVNNLYVARRLGNIANNIAFPLMTISYASLGVVAVVAVWT